jgi:polysaccharide export outer membrane protein
MKIIKHSFLGLFCLSSAIGASSVSAQNFEPSAEQLSTYQQLSPEEREQLLGALGDNSGVLRDAPLEFPEVVSPLEGESLSDVDITTTVSDELLAQAYGAELAALLVGVEPNVEDDQLDISFFDREISLQPFGYNLFAGVPSTFAPATDIPVPPDYIIGPGDTIELQLFGKENRQYSLVVQRDGTLNFPNIGPVVVIGRNFQSLKQDLLDRVSEDLIGVSAAISMGALRSIRVLVVGDALTPGSYTVSGLSTISNALFVSGGVSEVGSLRNIQIRRDGQLIRTLDLYDMLIRGNSQDDIRLQSGDVVFIPPIGETVGVGGHVKRPAVYELSGEKTVGDVLRLAGGLKSDAFPTGSRMERITSLWERSFISVDLASAEGQQLSLRAGDILLVPPVLDTYRNGVRLSGHVERAGDFEWREGLRLSDVITSLDVLKQQADFNYVLIKRETSPHKRIEAISANLEVALRSPESKENIFLHPRDIITVFDLEPEKSELADERLIVDPLTGMVIVMGEVESERRIIVDALLEKLELQSTSDNPFEKVTVGGAVRAPGTYPFEVGMSVSDLLRAGAEMDEGANIYDAEVSRYKVLDGKVRKTEVIKINPGAAFRGELDSDILLQPYDSLQIFKVQEFREQLSIKVTGEVKFPGRYSFNIGDTLISVIERAGGLTQFAFPAGGIFLREELKEREQKQLDFLKTRLESDLATLAIKTANEDDSVQETELAGRTLLAQLNNTQATGRLVIDLERMLKNPADTDFIVFLKGNDELVIPQTTQDVTVIGQVQFPTSHLYRKGLDRDDYIGRSGGVTLNAAKKQIYLVRANGAVFANNTSRWFRDKDGMRVKPGDTVVVPLDTAKVSKIRFWSDVTSVLSNLAITVAALNAL